MLDYVEKGMKREREDGLYSFNDTLLLLLSFKNSITNIKNGQVWNEIK